MRVGNGAHGQRQIDVYGQTLDLALLYQSLGGGLGEQYRRLLRTFAEFVVAHWEEPDQGLWEMRGPPRHHVHGKLMSWVAMDRARQLFDDGQDWAALAERIRAEICAKGIDSASGHLAQAFDGGMTPRSCWRRCSASRSSGRPSSGPSTRSSMRSATAISCCATKVPTVSTARRARS